MAKIRTIKTEFWTSEQVGICSIPARLLFIGLWNFCDDGGNHPASCYRLKTEIFPADNLTLEEIRGWVDELRDTGLLFEYEAESSTYWHITGFQKHQMIRKPYYKHPPPEFK